MVAYVIILPEPVIDYDLSVSGGCEPFRIQGFFAQGPIEPLAMSILPE